MADSGTTEAPTEERVGIVVIHGVGETEPGWINRYICDPLAEEASSLKLVSHSELHSLPDAGNVESGSNFNVLLRRARMGTKSIVFAELFWADLSRVGRGSLALMAATMRLFIEAPDVLAQAFMRGRRRGVHRLIAFLIQTSSRLLKWLVVGINLTIILSAFYMVGLLNLVHFLGHRPSFDRTDMLLWLAPVIAVLIVGGILLFVRKRHKDVALSEFGLGMALSALIIIAYLAADYRWPVAEYLGRIVPNFDSTSYYDNGRILVFWVWAAWCLCTVAAMGLLGLVWLKRRTGDGENEARFPLVAAWAAMFNILVQAIILKLVIAPLSMMSCHSLNDAARTFHGPDVSICDLGPIGGVFFFSLFELVCIVVALIVVVALRGIASHRAHPDPAAIPRLLVHRLLVVTAAITVLLHISVFAGELSKSGYGYSWWLNGWVMNVLKAAPLLTVYFFVLRTFYNSSAGVVHIARDIVDHQYRADSRIARYVDRRMAAKGQAIPDYPRRHRIACRLDAMIQNVLAGECVDKLIFLTHSQGSVIAFDYLRSTEPNPVLDRIREIHVVTLGSPLSHLYAYYFAEYQKPTIVAALRGNLKSWTNFWRLDDPIGNRVDVLGEAFIDNVTLGRGGHMNYWREADVRRYLLKLVSEPGQLPMARVA